MFLSSFLRLYVSRTHLNDKLLLPLCYLYVLLPAPKYFHSKQRQRWRRRRTMIIWLSFIFLIFQLSSNKLRFDGVNLRVSPVYRFQSSSCIIIVSHVKQSRAKWLSINTAGIPTSCIKRGICLVTFFLVRDKITRGIDTTYWFNLICLTNVIYLIIISKTVYIVCFYKRKINKIIFC